MTFFRQIGVPIFYLHFDWAQQFLCTFLGKIFFQAILDADKEVKVINATVPKDSKPSGGCKKKENTTHLSESSRLRNVQANKKGDEAIVEKVVVSIRSHTNDQCVLLIIFQTSMFQHQEMNSHLILHDIYIFNNAHHVGLGNQSAIAFGQCQSNTS